jgi:hypothetical protein
MKNWVEIISRSIRNAIMKSLIAPFSISRVARAVDIFETVSRWIFDQPAKLLPLQDPDFVHPGR